MKEKETDIQRAICDYLALKKYFFWRNNNTPIFDAGRKIFRAMPKYTMRGIPDIILIKEGGQFVGIEVKREKGVLSDHQKAFRALCDHNRALYIVAKSVDDVISYGL